MAKVLVINTREHAIHINVPGTATDLKGKAYVPQEPVIVPAARVIGQDKTNGQLMVDSEHLEVARKNPVVQHYFSEGWLRIQKEEKAEKTPKPADQ